MPGQTTRDYFVRLARLTLAHLREARLAGTADPRYTAKALDSAARKRHCAARGLPELGSPTQRGLR